MTRVQKKDRRLSANRSVHHHDEKEVVMPLETIKEKLTKQEYEDSRTIIGLQEMTQEEFVPCASLRGRFAAGVVTTVGRVESLPPSFHFGDLRRGRMSEAGLGVRASQVNGLFESLLGEAFNG